MADAQHGMFKPRNMFVLYAQFITLSCEILFHEHAEIPVGTPPTENLPQNEQTIAEEKIVVPPSMKAAEKTALNLHKTINLQSAPVRQYLESTVVPLLMQGMQSLSRERPEDPVEYLAYYLLSHNPKKQHSAEQTSTAPASQ